MLQNNKLIVYLAGDISKDRWRLQVLEACDTLPIEFLSPIDNISYSYQSLIPVHDKKKVFQFADAFKIDRSHVVFSYFKESSLLDPTGKPFRGTLYSGTSWECGYGRAKNKHVLVVNDMKSSLECRYELVKRMADAYYRTLEEGIEHLRELSFEMNFQLI